MATDFEPIRAELRAVRAERDGLKAAVQRSSGRRVDQAGSAELVARIRELIKQMEVRDETIKALTSERNELEHVLEEAQDDLISSRTALRDMIRAQNAPQDEVHWDQVSAPTRWSSSRAAGTVVRRQARISV
ncbi:hypothetical protein [Embleya sp. NPDC001921]